MQEPFAPAIAANRFGLGAKPGELDAIGAHAPEWLIAQLKGAPPVLGDAGLRSSESVLVETLEVRREQREGGGKKALKRAKSRADDAASGGASNGVDSDVSPNDASRRTGSGVAPSDASNRTDGEASASDPAARAAAIQKLLKL